MAIATVVVGATRRDLVVTIVDENNQVVDLTGGTARLQGRSQNIPSGDGSSIDALMTLSDPSQGEATYQGVGSLVTQGNLGAASVRRATYRFRVKYTDVAAEIDFTEYFEIIFDSDPLQPYW